jgi:hypothetical protein
MRFVMESIVWHTTLKMMHRKFMGYYRMSFEAFNNLVEKLSPISSILVYEPCLIASRNKEDWNHCDTTLKMMHRKFMDYYRMSFETFNNLVEK